MEENRTVLQSIATRKCLSAVYNRMAVTLAPHILYTRHEELFVDAVTAERNGAPPRELKLGTFKLSGLKELAVVDRDFEPSSLFDPKEPRYEGVTLFIV